VGSNTAGRVQETLEILDELIDSQTDLKLLFLNSMVFRLSSPVGFGQEGVLGRPDTGGQVVYVLDQTRA